MSISNGEELFKAAKYASEFFQRGEIWWRGQSKIEWPLLPGIFRRSDSFVEVDFANKFKRKALCRYNNCPRGFESPEWLFIMQHYRLPTRLLDWSESILVALYFAAKENFEDDGVVFALSTHELNKRYVGTDGILEPYGKLALSLILKAFTIQLPEYNKVAAICPLEFDVRIMNQLAGFTIHGAGVSLNSLTDSDTFLLKFNIPKGYKKLLFELLYQVGIRESNLFPDLDHLASELASFEYGSI